MKSYKEFRRTCPSGYKFDSKLGACVPKGNRHVSVVGRYLGGRQNDDSDNNKKNGSNGNGNGNGGNGNGNGGYSNGGNGGGNGGGGNGGGGGGE